MSKHTASVMILTLFVAFLTALTTCPVSHVEASDTEKQPRWSHQTVGTVNVVKVSPNGAYVVIGTSDGYTYLFDVDSNVPLDASSIGGVANVMGVSYYGKYVAVASGNTLNVYSITGDRLQFMWSFVNDPIRDQAGIHSLAFSSDGGLLVVGTWGYDDARTYVHFFNVTSGSKLWSYLVKEYTSYEYDYVSVDISSDGQYIAAGSTYTQNAYLFNSKNSTPVYSYHIESLGVKSVSISSDGRYFVVGETQFGVVYYFKNDVSVPQWSRNIGGGVGSVSISSSALYIAACIYHGVYLLRNDSNTVWYYNFEDWVDHVSFSANGEYVVAKSAQDATANFVHVFSTSLDGNPSTPTHDPVWSYNTKSAVNSVSISSDGRYTIAGSGTYAYLFDMAYDPDLTPTYIQFSNDKPADGDTITISARINNTGNLDSPNAFVKFYDGTILIGTRNTGSISYGSSVMVSISFTVSPSGTHIVKVIVDPENLIYESKENNNNLTKEITGNPFPFEDTGANPIITDVTQTCTINSVSISGNGYYIVLGTSESYAYLFFRNHTLPIWSYNAGGSINVVSVSGDGSYIALAVENTLSVLSRTNSEPLWSFVNDPIRDQAGIHSLAFSSDGGLLVVGTWGYDDARTYVHFFNVTSGSKLWSYLVKEYTSYEYDYVSVDISSDGQYIAAGSTYTQNAYLFNSKNSTPVYSYNADAAVNSVTMSFDGSYFVCGSNRIYHFSKDVIVPLWSRDIAGTVDSVSISGNASHIAATSETILFLLKNDNTELWKYNVKSSISQVLISTDGSYIVARSGNFVYIFSRTVDGEPNTPSHDPMWIYDAKNTISSISISTEGRYTVAGSGGKIFYFDVLHIIPVTLFVPTNVTSTSLKLSWSESTATNLARYEFYTSESSGQLGSLTVTITDQSITSYTVTNLQPSTTYYFVVRVVDTENKFSDSNQVGATTLPPPISPVTLDNPTNPMPNSIDLSWTQNTEEKFARYEIYVSTSPEDLGTVTQTITDQSSTTYTVTGLVASTTYYFVVRVVDVQGMFSDSNQVSGMTLPTPVVLYEPTERTNSSLLLRWTRNTDANFERYEIYMSNDAENLGSLVESFSDQSITTYNVTGLSPSTTYYFVVRVVNPQGLFSDSNQVKGKTLGGPSSPVVWNLLWILGIILVIAVPTLLYLRYRRSRKVYPPPPQKKGDETEIYGKQVLGTAPSVKLPSGKIRCGNCGVVNSPKAKYCKNCSEKIWFKK